jgi:uncharacterized protein (DUF2267 family)
MSTHGIDVFDKTLQTTHQWLHELENVVGPQRQTAWHVLGAVLRALRDRIPVELAAHLGSQLPILVRGAYYDQWRPAGKPERIRTRDEFLTRIAEQLEDTRPVNVAKAAEAVFGILARHVSPGQVQKVVEALPEEVRALWPAELARGAAQEAPHTQEPVGR